jgi:hypothetical protein
MADPKHSPREQGTRPETVTSFIREHDAHDVDAPAPRAALAGAPEPMRLDPEGFLEDWALRHFTVSVQLHDVERVSEGDAERKAVLEDLGLVQGVLLELHDFASGEKRVRALLESSRVLQNGVSALYNWLDEVLGAAARLRVTHSKPGFTHWPEEEAPTSMLRTLERVHPDLETLVHPFGTGADEDVGRKIALCFRQIGAAVVRVSGRAGSTIPPM